MIAIVLGATGFVGRHVVEELVLRGHQVTAVARNGKLLEECYRLSKSVRTIACDLYQNPPSSPRQLFGDADVIVDLVWPGLPNYSGQFHIEDNFRLSYQMLKSFASDDFRDIVVAGTCYEYGMQYGPLSTKHDVRPVTAYGVAKDCLRQSLVSLQNEIPFRLRWCRLFYLYGDGQNSGSLLPQLHAAIADGKSRFDMSGGEQLRDFLPVEAAAVQIADKAELQGTDGVFNVCSGRPISVRRLIEEAIAESGGDIELNLGHYPYPTYEPMSFWGEPN